MARTKIYGSKAEALAEFAANNPQPAGGRVEVDGEWSEYYYGTPGGELFADPGRSVFRPQSAEELERRIASPDRAAVPVEIKVVHVQTYYPDSQAFQSATFYIRD